MSVSNFKLFILLLGISSLSISFAGVGASCTENSEPGINQLDQICTNPYLYSELGEYGSTLPDCKIPFSPQNNLLYPQKSPYLFYYAVDTIEPLMIGAVDYELRKLRISCNRSRINFVAYSNGLYQKGLFAYCGKRNYRYQHVMEEQRFRVAQIPKTLYRKLEMKRNLLRLGKADNVSLTFPVPFNRAMGEEFFNYPLSHPDFFSDLYMESKRNLFPPKKFTSFIHIKSHGSASLVMTGPTSSELDEKVQCQTDLLSEQGSDLPIPKILEEGTGIGSLSSDWERDYGSSYLGIEVMLGIEVYLGIEIMLGSKRGLGVNGGLGSANHFGLSYRKLPQVLTHIIDSTEKSEIGFIMYESCESNLGARKNLTSYQAGLSLLRGHYSAIGSLWYRNLDWHTLLESSQNAGQLQEALIDSTRKIPNFVRKD